MNGTGPDWSKINDEERETISRIVKRFEIEAKRIDALPRGYKPMTLTMDISAAHIACPIDLGRLLGADSTSFLHDVGGISRHINRETGELGGCFVPRTAKRPEPAVCEQPA